MSQHHRGEYDSAAAQAERSFVLLRDGFTCQLRGPTCTVVATTVDHTLPASKGGPSHRSNMVAACRNCNSRKSNKTAPENETDLPDWMQYG